MWGIPSSKGVRAAGDYHKTKGRRKNYASPQALTLLEACWITRGLERELHTEPKRRRELEDCSPAVERIRNGRDARSTTADLECFVLTNGALSIEHVEPVNRQAQLFVFTDRNRIVRAEVQIVGRRRAVAAGEWVDRRAALHAEALVIPIRKWGIEPVEWNARLRVEVTADQELKGRPVRAVKLQLVRAVVRQPAIHVLEQTDEVEQAGDVRVRLAVVVAEQTFVITNQARVNVRSDELIVVRKALRGA